MSARAQPTHAVADTTTVRLRITDLAAHDRPRERLLAAGASALGDAELLAILLRTGVPGTNAVDLAQRLLRGHGGWRGLQQVSPQELARTPGVEPAKAAQILAALDIARRLHPAPPASPAAQTTADLAARLPLDMAALTEEQWRTVLLNARGDVLATPTVLTNGSDHGVLRPADVFREALRVGAQSVLLVHNHVDGDPSPSATDWAITQQCIAAGHLLGVLVQDHLIIGHGRCVSLRALGYAFPA